MVQASAMAFSLPSCYTGSVSRNGLVQGRMQTKSYICSPLKPSQSTVGIRFSQFHSSLLTLRRSFHPSCRRATWLGTGYARPVAIRCEDESSPVVPPAAGSAIALDPATQSKYTFWRYRVFVGLLLGFTASYFTRGCFTYVAPLLRSEYGLTLTDFGIINSVFSITQGISKFTSGIIADRVDAKTFLAAGLIITGLLDCLMCAKPTVWWMTIIIGLIGWISQFVVPSCAKMLNMWYSSSERGSWWGMWNMGANFGGFLVALISGYSASTWGWRYGMYVPGLLGVAIGILAYFVLQSDPADLKLPPVEEFRGEAKPQKGVVKEVMSVKEKNALVLKHVMKNPYVWAMGISWAFVYFIRQGVTSWSHFYLMDVKGVKDASDAAARVSGRELGGLAGSLMSGWVSDKVFGGKRVPVIITYTVGLIFTLFVFWMLPGGNRVMDYATIAVLGFFIYGPQNIIGLAGTEYAPKSVASSAIGLTGLLSYAGATFSGAPITYLVKKFGWNVYFQSMLACCGLIIALCLPLWNKRSYADEQADLAKADLEKKA